MAESKIDGQPIAGLTKEKFAEEAFGFKKDQDARLKDSPIIFKPQEDNFGVEILIPAGATILTYGVGGEAKATRSLKARFFEWVSENPVSKDNGRASVAILPQENFNEEELKRYRTTMAQLPNEQPDLAERTAKLAKDFNLQEDPNRAWLKGAIICGANLSSGNK